MSDELFPDERSSGPDAAPVAPDGAGPAPASSAPMTVRPDTWSVPALTEHVRGTLASTYGESLWVEGEIANLSRGPTGHVYFTLVEPGADRRTAEHTLAVTLFDWNRQNVNRLIRRSGASMKMEDGVRVRVRGALELYAARSTLQLRMTSIDPTFTLGAMAAERDRLLAALGAEGLLDANRHLHLPFLPQRIALITSIGSAAHADALHELARSVVAFEILAIDSRVQGVGSAEQLCLALQAAVELGVELVAIVRGGGSRTDLVVFDHEAVARAIAAMPVPVLAGIGHETDRTVVDDVCHSFKTPTACAAAVVELAERGRMALEDAWDSIVAVIDQRTRRERELHHRAGLRLGAACRGGLVRATGTLDRSTDRLASASRARLESGRSFIHRAEATLTASDPQRVLARGWSITRTAEGRIARAAELDEGAELITTVADGVLNSTVNTTSATNATNTASSASRATSFPADPPPASEPQ